MLIINTKLKVSELIFHSPELLLIFEHFEIPFQFHKKTIAEISLENDLNPEVFVSILRMCKGLPEFDYKTLTSKDLARIIKFLKNAHRYYEDEKYPEIKSYIRQLNKVNKSTEIKLVGNFFDEYFSEVKEHLNYEDKIAFPYFEKILEMKNAQKIKKNFSVNEYSNHHSDIKYKLQELIELLLNHIPIKNDSSIRRKIVLALYELQNHLNVHSAIEDKILVPSIAKFEREIFG